MPNIEQNNLIFKYAADVRKFEINLFWQRSLFFWGFIGAAFIAYAQLISKDKTLSLAIGCFGLVCSVAWTLGNRGSKYWQEAWEQKVESVQSVVLGRKLFSDHEAIKKENVCWNAARFSVSKLTIALSDFTVLVWIALIFKAAPSTSIAYWSNATNLPVIMVYGTVLYSAIMLLCGRSAKSDLGAKNCDQENSNKSDALNGGQVVQESSVMDQMLKQWEIVIGVQKHFNEIILKMRTVGFSVVTGLYGAAFVTLREHFSNFALFGLHFHPAAIIICVALMLLAVIWLLDFRYYFQLLLKSVERGEELERRSQKITMNSDYEPLRLTLDLRKAVSGKFADTVIRLMYGLILLIGAIFLLDVITNYPVTGS